MQGEIALTDSIMSHMSIGKVFKDFEHRINSLDFHRVEDLLVTGSDDDCIRIYNVETATLQDTFKSPKYGVHNVCFTHHPAAVLHASSKGDDHSLRYLNLHDNRYMRFFRGHTNRITSLAISPKNDLFMSSALDKSVRLWDLRTSVCQGLLQVPCQPCSNFDQQGLVFAVGTESGVVKLYDVRSYDKGPFDTFVVHEEANQPTPFNEVVFSGDGKLIAAVVEGRVHVLDAFKGHTVSRLTTGIPDGATPAHVSFTPDSQYIASGCEDRQVRVWSCASGAQVCAWAGHAGLPYLCCWHPRRLLLASACQAVALWVPRMSEVQAAMAQHAA